MNYNDTLEYLKSESISYFDCVTEVEFNERYNKSNFIYLIKWNKEDVFNWGTMTTNSNRIRRSSLLNKKLTGKYDRRVDYLLLHKIFGLEILSLFEFKTNEESRFHEGVIKKSKNQKHCFSGIEGANRVDISNHLYKLFKKTEWFLQFDDSLKVLFNEFFYDVFLGKLKHPNNSKRTFYYGDSLEPKFLRTINKQYLEEPVEKILDVYFPDI